MERGIALVTGGGTGIGAACCEALAAEGFCVAVHYNHSREAAERVSARLGNSFTLQADLSLFESAEKVADEISKRKEGLSVLVNNAGIARDNYIFSSALEEFDAVINTNLRAAWSLTKRLVKPMMRRREGRIINITSVIGHTGNAGQAFYGMSKAALDNFTKTAAIEFARHGILVNSVAPGFIDTDMTAQLPAERRDEMLARIPLGRMGTAFEVAEVVKFLATSASYCSGSIFHVNGGLYGG
ncbi:MAG: SDR family oxidoreductase [Deltaproteobacteria bacterium]|nr:SDR family oxidoreductase [Deltaproteobacteria bacterium]